MIESLGARRRMQAFPENQTFLRRAAAGVLDCLVFMPWFCANSWAWRHLDYPAQRLVWFVLQSFIFVAYSITMHAVYGQTLGKMAARVAVFQLDGSPITWRHAVLRDLPILVISVATLLTRWPLAVAGTNPYSIEGEQTGLASSLIENVDVMWFYVELITMWSNARRRAVHDFIAGTMVCRVRRAQIGA